MKNFTFILLCFISAFSAKVFAQNKDIVHTYNFPIILNTDDKDSMTNIEQRIFADYQDSTSILKCTNVNFNIILHSKMDYMNKHFSKPLKNFGVSFLKAISDTCTIVRILGNLSNNSFHPNRFLYGCLIIEDYKFYIYNDCNVNISKILIPQKEKIQLQKNENIPSLIETQSWFYLYTPNSIQLIQDNLGHNY